MKNSNPPGKLSRLHFRNNINTAPQVTGPPLNNFDPFNKIWMDKYDLLSELHMSERTLQMWRSKGVLPFSKIGGKIYYKRKDVEELLEKKRALSLG